MHDRTRRNLTLVLFLVLGPGLTVALLGAIGGRRLPATVSREEKQMGSPGNWEVRIGSVEFANIHHRRYRDFTILHPGTLQPLIVIPELEIKKFRTKHDPVEDTLVVHAATARVILDSNANENDRQALREVFSGLFRKRLPGKIRNVEVSFETVELCRASDAARNSVETFWTFSFFRGRYVCEGEDASLHWDFSLPDNIAVEPLRFSAKRYGGPEHSPMTVYELATGETTIPCRILALVLPDFAEFGDRASFSGTMRAECSGRNRFVFTMEDIGFRNVTLDFLAERFTPHHLRGTMDFCLKHLILHRSERGVENLEGSGWFQIRRGAMEKQLLDNFVDHYGLIALRPETGTVLPSDPLVRYRSGDHIPFLSFGAFFELGEKGCRFQPGAVEQASETVLLVHPQQLLYRLPEDSEQWRSYSSMLDPLMPGDAELVPLTRQSLGILRYVPREAVSRPMGSD